MAFNSKKNNTIPDDITIKHSFKLKSMLYKKHDINSSKVAEFIATAKSFYQNKLNQTYTVAYPPNLPVSKSTAEIKELIQNNQVLILAGDTGSGKTTQIPKMLLELGYGIKGVIGQTQPRRIAAKTVASRLAVELENPDVVGSKIRFNDKTSPLNLIRIVTDGVLLANLSHDKLLLDYDAIIIDEAHERSLNIDFIIAYIKSILPKRPDLKIIITSATINIEKFTQYFDAPAIQVEGKTYPITTQYMPLAAEDRTHPLTTRIQDAILELLNYGSGDILVFLSGEREIMEIANFLNKETIEPRIKALRVLPLYSRLAYQDQLKIFDKNQTRRVVLATNVAETSITIPNIRFVIDCGTARISRYNHKSKVQRLPIEPISQASANQRKGRCGRVAEGVCIRLYSEEDYNARPAYIDPEIKRTNLASVILKIKSLKIGDISDFEFLDQPESAHLTAGMKLLTELKALTTNEYGKLRLNKIGYALAKIPLDPKIARMLLAAGENKCLTEVLIIACGLSIMDPRDYPADKKQASIEKHNRFADKKSDFLSYLNLYNYINEQIAATSKNQFRKLCQKEFLSFSRVREWLDLHRQIQTVLKDSKFKFNTEPATYEQIHKSLLTGLLSNIATKDPEGEFVGASAKKLLIFPASALAKKPPKWVVASNLIELSRLYASCCAEIMPLWLEDIASHLVKKSYLDPYFCAKQNSVLVHETQKLYGLPIVNNRKKQFGVIDPKQAREIFIRSGLVENQWDCRLKFYKHNQNLIAELSKVEDKQRRKDVIISDEQMYSLYDAKIPDNIYNAITFNKWWKQQQRVDPQYLNFKKEDFINKDTGFNLGDFPDAWLQDSLSFPLKYYFDIHDERDGVAMTVPVPFLNRIAEADTSWLVAGMLEEQVMAFIKSLPKVKRKLFIPANHYVTACIEALTYRQGNFVDELCVCLQKMSGQKIEPQDFDLTKIPPHLKMTYEVVDENNKVIASSKNLVELQEQYKDKAAQIVNKSNIVQVVEYTDWDFADLADSEVQKIAGVDLTVFPAVVRQKNAVVIKNFDNQQEAQVAHRLGVIKLLSLGVDSLIKYLEQNLTNKSKLSLYFNPMGSVRELIDDITEAVIACSVDNFEGVITSKADFLQVKQNVKDDFYEMAMTCVSQVEDVLLLRYKIMKQIKKNNNLNFFEAISDIRAHIDQLIFKGFVSEFKIERMPDVLRYLKAIEVRLEKMPADVRKDRELMVKLQKLEQVYKTKLQNNNAPEIEEIKWMFEECKVSLFAQQLKTKFPISLVRIEKALNKL